MLGPEEAADEGHPMRAILAVGLVLAVACEAAADEKIDARKLVGKWEWTDPAGVVTTTFEYAADGKLAGQYRVNGTPAKFAGTYKLKGDQLTQTVTFEDEKKDVTETTTVTRLTDEVLETELKGQKLVFKRLKDKK